MPEEIVGTPQPTQPLEPQPKNWPKIILTAVLGLALLAGAAYAGYWYGTESSKLKDQISKPQLKTQNQIAPTPTPTPSPIPTPTPGPTANRKTYTDENYGFSFAHPQNWNVSGTPSPDGPGISLSNIANGHTISVKVWRVTGFGYCYKYDERKEIVVGGKIAETADGIGGSEMCDKPEEFSNRGNTFVLIPIDDADTTLPRNQIHISYDYPLDDVNLAKSNLDQILSTFKFLD